MMHTLIALAAATLVSEDLTATFAGVLIAQGALSPLAGVSACAAGIYSGDLLLFAAGRACGARVLVWKPVARALSTPRLAGLGHACDRRLGGLILASRFVPGSRLPLYLAAGALGCSTASFAAWSALAVLLWTPAIVLASANVLPQPSVLESWPARVAVAAAFVFAIRASARFLSGGRWGARTVAAVSRIWRWEFWPMGVFYAPVAAWLLLLVIRHRGTGVISAANPGFPDGGIVGESKYDILQLLPPAWIIPSMRIDPDALDTRVWRLADWVARRQWQFPIVCKPDVGQRGAGVKLVRSLEDARRYFEREGRAVLVQPYHAGPFEAGVFYYRLPGTTHGRILSITDKHFPVVVGDGRSTIEDLIWSDGRLRMQVRTFVTRLGAGVRRVPAVGERVPLALAGNHCQGTLFRDGCHLITPALEGRIDHIARATRGFFIGRFDIRYADVERFKAGDDLAIVELNGATAESTNIYDPSGSLVAAYRLLFRQWSLVYAIGAANRARGARTTSLRRLINLLRAHLNATPAFETSD